jgi:hypothetical protein
MGDLDHLREPLCRWLRGEAAVWPRLETADVDALVRSGVAPLVHAAGHLPELRDEARRAAALEPLRLADLRAVLKILAEAGVSVLIVKGSTLAYDLYESPELRPRSDTDLFLARPAFDLARTALTAAGYAELPTSGDEHGLRQRTFVRRDRHDCEHAYDVHWAVANTPLFADVLRFDEIAPVALPRIGPDAFGLPRVEALLLACIHRVAHHHDDERLIWLVDIARLRARMSDEEHQRFWRMAADRRMVAVCRRSIELTESWLGPTGPRAGKYLSAAELDRDEPSRLFLDPSLTYGAMTAANLRALPWRARLTRLRQLAFPPVSFMQQSFGARNPIVLSCLYVYRGARGISRLFRKASLR